MSDSPLISVKRIIKFLRLTKGVCTNSMGKSHALRTHENKRETVTVYNSLSVTLSSVFGEFINTHIEFGLYKVIGEPAGKKHQLSASKSSVKKRLLQRHDLMLLVI